MHKVQRLLPRHHKIMDLALEGLSKKAIADEIGMSAVAVGYITSSQLFQDALARRREKHEKTHDEASSIKVIQAKDKLNEASVSAADTLIGQLNHEDGRIAQGSAKEILSHVFPRAGDRGSDGPTIVIDKASITLLEISLNESDDYRKTLKAPIEASVDDNG